MLAEKAIIAYNKYFSKRFKVSCSTVIASDTQNQTQISIDTRYWITQKWNFVNRN